jgi:SPP1 gp7 family putative phage head morphogenesis protein
MKPPHANPMEDSDAADLEGQLKRLLARVVFAPLAAVLKAGTPGLPKLRNASLHPLLSAIRSGRISYQEGVFKGQFSAAISLALRSFGARRSQWSDYRIPPSQVPDRVVAAALEYSSTIQRTHELLTAQIDAIRSRIDEAVDHAHLDITPTMQAVQRRSRVILDAVSVHPYLPKDYLDRMGRDYSKNLDLSVKGMLDKTLLDMRDDIIENAHAGYRSTQLHALLFRRYGVALNHAKFLARNETSIYLSKYRQARFEEAGINRYLWQTAHDIRVRLDHQRLDGLEFSWDNPPIVDSRTGARANPGEYFQCRCVARPIIPQTLEVAHA